MYSAKVNNRFEFTNLNENSEVRSQQTAGEMDLVVVGDGRFHVLMNNKSYNADLISFDRDEKLFEIRVNGNNYEVKLTDKYDELLQKLGMSSAASHKLNNLKAPMPGLVIDIKVAEGQAIKKGDALLILEAMKMENVLKASGDGMVKKICVKQKDAVEKGQVLVEFE